MGFISKAGSCVVDNASKAWSLVGSKLPNRTPKNAGILIATVTLFLARNRVFNIASKILRFVGSKLPNPTLKNAVILITIVALLYAAVKRFYFNNKPHLRKIKSMQELRLVKT